GAASRRVVSFASAVPAGVRAAAIEGRGAVGSAFQLRAPAVCARLEIPRAGRHAIANALAALAAASLWGAGPAEAKRVFPRLRPASMRGEVLRFDDGFALINDCYNSSPVALAAMIDLLVSTPGHRRRILAAGAMLELGT